MLLADPEVRLLMHADKVDESDLLRMLQDISIQLQSFNSGSELNERAAARDRKKYRRGVGIMLVNARCEIFIARRNDIAGDAWQMPQGGVDRGETPRAAAYRELREEIGTDKVEVIAQSRDRLYYDLPEDIIAKFWGGRWKGQRQKWFLMRFRGVDADINLEATTHPEFNSWRWASIEELETLVISFKKKLYLSVIDQFRSLLDAERGLLAGREDRVARTLP
jgi:8-oxo-dGTP pyrophosphatase MutT (NUDIX family)